VQSIATYFIRLCIEIPFNQEHRKGNPIKDLLFSNVTLSNVLDNFQGHQKSNVSL